MRTGSAGDVLLDVGTGTGLIAFGALEQVGEPGRVIFSDVSQDVLAHWQALAQERGVLERCQFVRAPADDLAPVAEAEVNVVTTRSVLIKAMNGSAKGATARKKPVTLARPKAYSR